MNPEQAPQTLNQVLASVQDTLLQVWADFVNRMPFIAAGLVILLLTWLVVAMTTRIITKTLHRSQIRGSLQELILRLISISIWIVGIMAAAIIVFPGLTPAKALGAMGIISIAVGFAFKDIFENFFAGILLLWRFPFERGDFIECEGIQGRIEDITVRMTQMRQVSGELVVVPNSFLFMNPVQVLTNLNRRRVTIITGVAYGEQVAQAVAVIEKAVQQCKTVRQDQPVEIFPQGFGNSSIDIEVTWWTGPQPVDIRRSRGEVVTAVKWALDEAGIEIPFPYRTLTFKEPLETRVMSAQKLKSVGE
jgi:small-conductance mechanosensitive channel